MASQEMKNRRRALAVERLNISIARLAAKYQKITPDIPKKMKDRDMLEIVAFERIAEFLEGLAQDAPVLEEHPLVKKQSNRDIQNDTAKPKRRTPKTASSEVSQ